jgi:CheY-like chemotaxis protein
LRDEHSRDSLLLLAAVTGYGSEDDRRQCAENGFDIHITKPIELAILLEVLDGVAQDCLSVN